MTQHTPGPWHIDGETRGNEVCTIHGLPMNDKGRTFSYIYHGFYLDWRGEAEQAANARLIAAAPELLEALKEIADAGAEAWGANRPCVQMALAAIAKAEGRT